MWRNRNIYNDKDYGIDEELMCDAKVMRQMSDDSIQFHAID